VFTLEGKVTLSGSNAPIAFVQVFIKELAVWGISNEDGNFKISGIIPGTYILEASLLGFQKFSTTLTISNNVTSYRINMSEENFALSEIVVTAQAGSSINSSSWIGSQALEHIQATTLKDVMQLLPGIMTTNPSLNSASENRIMIRTIMDPNNSNARGVGLLINGSKINTDAVLIGGNDTDYFDFRKIPTSNIESLEVLKGVVSAEYGDFTSGVLDLKLKAGRTPYEVTLKTDSKTKALSFGKGFALGKDAGFININLDYANSANDVRSPINITDRITYGFIYSNTFNKNAKPFRFNLKFSGVSLENSTTQDPEKGSVLDYSKRKDRNFSVSTYGNWMLNKPWITTLNYNLHASRDNSYLDSFTMTTQSSLPTTNTMVTGIAEGFFTEINDPRTTITEDIPIYFNSKISGDLNKKIGNVLIKTKLGFEFGTKGNKGEGISYPDAAPQWYRSRPYTDIPFMSDFSLFLNENITVPMGKQSLEIALGARMTKMIISGYTYDPILDPRFNAQYNLIKDRSKIISSLSLRGGWGIMQRLPGIYYLYPGDSYTDRTVFQYRNTEKNQQLVVVDTKVTDQKLSYNLLPTKTTKMEIGLDVTIGNITAKLAYFSEKLRNGFTENSTYQAESIKYYNTVTDTNADPKFENGIVYLKNASGIYEEAPHYYRKEFRSYRKPVNQSGQDNWGIEYDLDFGKIQSLNTSVIVNGAYIRNDNLITGNINYYNGRSDILIPTEMMFYYGIYDYSGTVASGGNAYERFNTSIYFVTNIPKLRMVVTLTTQCVWKDRNWYICDPYTVYQIIDGKRVYDDYTWKKAPEGVLFYRDPIAYVDMDGNVTPFPTTLLNVNSQSSALDRRLDQLRISETEAYFVGNKYNPYFMGNLRVTKEIGNIATLSFYANNFTNSRPLLRNKARPGISPIRRNTEIYFGAELKITF